jgi:hypothetical protein
MWSAAATLLQTNALACLANEHSNLDKNGRYESASNQSQMQKHDHKPAWSYANTLLQQPELLAAHSICFASQRPVSRHRNRGSLDITLSLSNRQTLLTSLLFIDRTLCSVVARPQLVHSVGNYSGSFLVSW